MILDVVTTVVSNTRLTRRLRAFLTEEKPGIEFPLPLLAKRFDVGLPVLRDLLEQFAHEQYVIRHYDSDGQLVAVTGRPSS